MSAEPTKGVVWLRWSRTLNNWSLCEQEDHGAIAFMRVSNAATGPELDKALNDFVADKPKDIMR